MIGIFITLFCLIIADALLLLVCWKQNNILKSHNRMIRELGETTKAIVKGMRAEMVENYEPIRKR